MGKITVDQVLAEAKALSRDEQQQLRDTLDAWLQPESLEDRLERLLYEAGLLSDIHPAGAIAVSSTPFTPIEVRGQPVSETLIEERR